MPKRITPESSLLKACTDLLTAERIWFERRNTGAFLPRGRGHGIVRLGKPGTADIMAVVKLKCDCGANGNLCHRRWPTPVWIECKSKTGRLSDAQQDFANEVIADSQIWLLIRDVDELRNWLKEHGNG